MSILGLAVGHRVQRSRVDSTSRKEGRFLHRIIALNGNPGSSPCRYPSDAVVNISVKTKLEGSVVCFVVHTAVVMLPLSRFWARSGQQIGTTSHDTRLLRLILLWRPCLPTGDLVYLHVCTVLVSKHENSSVGPA